VTTSRTAMAFPPLPEIGIDQYRNAPAAASSAPRKDE
jgi:hypothetical protein